ncbi:MAG: beta-ketoacyl synthase N-terminal-like domain-containing protein [Bacilli bacterium]
MPECGGSGKADISSLLKGIPMLKNASGALSKIGLQSAMSALDGVDVSCDACDVAVCIGTGLGMVSETARFVESTIAHRESEPLPTAFTNSVHNAVSSLISLRFGFKALNSAVTAKEISFECALWQAWCEINSVEAAAAVVGACDEYSITRKVFALKTSNI